METYPIRINKYLALKNYSTRKGGDELVANRKVLINGKVAVLGDKVNENDVVTVKQDPRIAKQYLYIAYNKPRGVITHSPQHGEEDIRHAIGLKNLFPVGRLDKDSNGLIILTNDGRVTDRLLNPKYAHEKEYIVRTAEKLPANFKHRMEKGVNIEGYITKNCRITIVNNNTFKITLTEGKKHQIRRMCAAMDNAIVDLQRIRIMNIQLGNLKEGEYRTIEGEEKNKFLRSIGL